MGLFEVRKQYIKLDTNYSHIHPKEKKTKQKKQAIEEIFTFSSIKKAQNTNTLFITTVEVVIRDPVSKL